MSKHYLTTLLTAAFVAIGGGYAQAQTDVTSTYIDNADFSSGTPVTVHVVAYQPDAAKDANKLNSQNAAYWAQTVDNWDIAQENKNTTNSGAGSAGAIFAYGGDPELRGASKKAPATNPNGEATGNALGFFGAWGGVIQYTQTAKTPLSAGHYELTYTYYNQGKNSNIGENLIGFIEDGGTTHYGEKSFETGGWKTATVSFDLTTSTSGKFSIGIKSSGSGSGSNAMLFVDNLTLTYTDPLAAAKNAYTAAKTAAQTAIDASEYANVTGDEKTALQSAIDATVTETQEGYTSATTTLTTATNAFTAAKSAYDNFVAEKTIADAVSATYSVSPTSATEATSALQTLNVAEYTAVTSGYKDVTSLYDAASWSPNNFGIEYDQHWDGKSGFYTKWTSSASTQKATKTITLPAGKWVLKTAGRAATTASITMTANGTTVTFPSNGDTGFGITTSGVASFADASTDVIYANDNKGRGWQWRFIPITLTAETNIEININATLAASTWAGFCNFTILLDNTTADDLLASETEYNALNNAIKNHTVGFEKDEYAPYNNVDAMKALAAAKAIDQTANNLKTTVTEATTALNSATWKANTEEVNAVNNGTLKDVEVSTDASKTGAAMQALGWSANGTNYRQILGDVTSYPALSQTTDGRAVYTWGATFKYGETTGYTMPLKANTKYQITFKYCGWNGANNSFGVSVLDANNNGLATKTYSKASAGPQTAGAFISVKKVFTTGEAGDYVLSMIPSGNSTFADVVIVKAVPDEVTLDEAATAAPTASEYANVTLNRTFAAGWNSIVLPFATTATALGADEAAEYNGTEENKLKFSTVTDLKANTPYLVHFTAEQTAAKTFEGVTINPATEPKATGTDYDFVGTYTALAKDNTTIAEGDYITVKAGIQKAKGGNKLNAFRAYFKNNNPTATSEAKNMVLVIDDNTISTGINAVNAESVDDGNVYNVAGQKVSSSYKGLVIKNGKKYLRK